MNLDEVERDMTRVHPQTTIKEVNYTTVSGRTIHISKCLARCATFPPGTWLIWTLERGNARKANQPLDPLMAQCIIYDFFQRHGPCAMTGPQDGDRVLQQTCALRNTASA